MFFGETNRALENKLQSPKGFAERNLGIVALL